MNLIESILEKVSQQDKEKVLGLLNENIQEIYPFNKYEYIFTNLISDGVITIHDYHNIRNEYMEKNKYLHLYSITPKIFGGWGEKHIKELYGDFISPSKETDPNYDGEYDLTLPNHPVKIEVKASRVAHRKKKTSLESKALYIESEDPFLMNFQQLKPKCCDVFIWIVIWRNAIRYYVIPSYDVNNHPLYSNKQHRFSVDEGQLHITEKNIHLFDRYIVEKEDLKKAVLFAYDYHQSKLKE